MTSPVARRVDRVRHTRIPAAASSGLSDIRRQVEQGSDGKLTTVLVAGATGSLGSLIVKNLLDRGADVRALVRKSSVDRLTAHPNLTPRVGDLTDGADALAHHVDGVEVVVSAV